MHVVLPGWEEAVLDRNVTSATAAGVAFGRLLTGRVEEARDFLERAHPDEVSDDAGAPLTFAWYSEVAAAIGTPELRRRWLDAIKSMRGVHFATGGSYCGPVNRLCALLHDSLGDHDAADECFELGVGDADTLGAPTFAARTRIDWAESLIGRGDAQRGRTLLSEAEAIIGDLELTESAGRIATLRQRLS